VPPRKTTAKGKAKSIQAESNKRGNKSYASIQNAKTLRQATRHGTAWTDDDVEILVSHIEADKKTLDMAFALKRTFYSAQVARSHTAWAMRHQRVIIGHFVPEKKKATATKPHAGRGGAKVKDELATRRRKRA
jgi:hypothetical protein